MYLLSHVDACLYNVIRFLNSKNYQLYYSKMKKLLFILLLTVFVGQHVSAQYSEFEGNSAASQYTLSSEANTLQISGRVSGSYGFRILKDDTNYQKKSHNGFGVKDIDLNLFGKTASKFVYEFHLAFADLVQAAASNNTSDPGNPGMNSAYIQYRGWPVRI